MPEAFQALIDLLAANALRLFLVSFVSLVAGSVLGAWFLAQLPADYFCSAERQRLAGGHWVIRMILLLFKNALGLLLMVAGFIMLFTPGQGVLTLLAGLMLTDFPGKYALERRLARRRSVMRALNWLRAKRGVEPFQKPD